MDKSVVNDKINNILAADQNCSANAFNKAEVTIVTHAKQPGRRRFPFDPLGFVAITTGQGIVITCSEQRYDWAQDALGALTPDEFFEISTLAHIEEIMREDDLLLVGPHMKFSCAKNTFKPFEGEFSETITFECLTQNIAAYYQYEGFGHALQYDADSERPDRALVVAKCQQTVIGMAGASADCDNMWQIGVQVLPEYQKQGVGKALVSHLTAYLLEQHIIPYYTTSLGHLASQNLALSLGYWPAWVEMRTVR